MTSSPIQGDDSAEADVSILGKPVDEIRDGIYKAIGAAIFAGLGSLVFLAYHFYVGPKQSGGGYFVMHTYNPGYYIADSYNPGHYEIDGYNPGHIAASRKR